MHLCVHHACIDIKRRTIRIIGWYGVLAILGAYALVNFEILSTTSLWYQLLNFTGAIGIMITAISRKDKQPATLNAIWALIALISILKILMG